MSYKTGDTCPTSGWYVFDSYVNAPSGTSNPTDEERVIPMKAGNPFPPVKSTNQAAYWKLLRAT